MNDRLTDKHSTVIILTAHVCRGLIIYLIYIVNKFWHTICQNEPTVNLRNSKPHQNEFNFWSQPIYHCKLYVKAHAVLLCAAYIGHCEFVIVYTESLYIIQGGWTPLVSAAFFGNTEVVETLIVHGAESSSNSNVSNQMLYYYYNYTLHQSLCRFSYNYNLSTCNHYIIYCTVWQTGFEVCERERLP